MPKKAGTGKKSQKKKNNEASSSSSSYRVQMDAAIEPVKKQMTMGNHRSECEKSMKKTQNMIRNKRKNEASARASEERNKGIKRQKVVVEMVSSVVPVETEHEKMVATLEEPVLSIYMKNYHEFLVNQAQGMNQASILDRQEDEERRARKEKAQKRKIIRAHKLAFQPCLKAIATQVPHTMTPDKPLNTMNGNGTLSGYFGNLSGKNTTAAERFWRRVYHENVKVSTTIIQTWPVFNNNTMDYSSGSSRNTNVRDMRCEQCNLNYMVDMKQGNMSCPGCGVVTKGGEGIGYQVTFSHQQATQKAAAPYERLAHVSITFLPLLFCIAFTWFSPHGLLKVRRHIHCTLVEHDIEWGVLFDVAGVWHM